MYKSRISPVRINWRTNYVHFWRINIIYAPATVLKFFDADPESGWKNSDSGWKKVGSQQAVSARIIPNSAVEIFSPKTEGKKTKAARVLIRWLPCNFGILYLPT
jgi:hypothetical protein